MRIRRMNTGYTIIELLVVVMLVGVLFAFVTRGIASAVFDYRLDASVDEADRVLDVLERVRRSAISTAVDAEGRYTHTYPTLAAGSSIADLESLIPSGDAGVPTTSRFNTPFLVTIGADTVAVSFDIPGAVGVQYPGATSTPMLDPGDSSEIGSTLTFTHLGPKRLSQVTPLSLVNDKGFVYDELPR